MPKKETAKKAMKRTAKRLKGKKLILRRKPAPLAGSRLQAATPPGTPSPTPPPQEEPATPTTGPQPITERDYPEFRALLLAERERLLKELTAMGQQLRQVEELGLVEQSSEDDYGDVATEAFEREKGFALETSVQGMLRMVEDALRKLETGRYGICERCGQPIGIERLRALPFATLCIRCKTEEERERQYAHRS